MANSMSLSDLHILLVEPSHMQAELTQRMLSGLGVSGVRRCEQADEALAAMRDIRPSAVISSLYLPDISGTELVMAMRREDDLERVPFILISSETRPQVLDPVRQSGACCIVAKPFTEEQLARALYAVIDLLAPPEVLDIAAVEELRVLLVDDSLSSRRYVRHLLEDMGIETILEAENGREAITQLAETMVDLVLTDYNMPEMDGKALVEYIRTQSWQASVPILMITSEHDQGRLAAIEKAGVSAICNKSFGATDMRKVITEALSL
ncbi:response regulator [Betaproteobacteria bacterium]|nr:response regulator [Betaproteobacteria bacterium]